MSERVYIRVTMNKDTASRELISDQIKIADLSYQDVTNAIIEVTSILRHGRGDVSLRVSDKVIEMSFVEALDFVMQATSSLRW
jgi:predicted DNA-binding ArsR family transcriptional regulator